MSNCTDGLFQPRYYYAIITLLLFARETGSKFFPKTVPQCNSTQHPPSLAHSLDRHLSSSFNSHFQTEAKKIITKIRHFLVTGGVRLHEISVC